MGEEKRDESLDPGEFYDLASPYYDEVIMGPFKEKFTDGDETTFLSTFFEKKSRLLDLGSGTGRSISLLMDSYDVFGVDISKGMLRKAVKRNVRTCVLADIRRLPFQNHVFDGGFSLHGGLSHLPSMTEKKETLEEIDRTMRPRCSILIDVPSPYREDRGDTFMVEWQAGPQTIKLRGYGWYPEEFDRILTDLDYTDIQLFGDYILDKAFDKTSRRLIIKATREPH